jgi:hypothetical protein
MPAESGVDLSMHAETARDLILRTLERHPEGLCMALVLREHAAEGQPLRALFLQALVILERRDLVLVNGPGGFTTLKRCKNHTVAGALVRLRQSQTR